MRNILLMLCNTNLSETIYTIKFHVINPKVETSLNSTFKRLLNTELSFEWSHFRISTTDSKVN